MADVKPVARENVRAESKYARKVRAQMNYLKHPGNDWHSWVRGRRAGTIKVG